MFNMVGMNLTPTSHSFTNVDNVLQGSGFLGSGLVTNQKAGVIDATGRLQVGSLINQGLLESTSPDAADDLLLDGVAIDQSGGGSLVANGGVVTFRSGAGHEMTTVVGGLIDARNGGTFQVLMTEDRGYATPVVNFVANGAGGLTLGASVDLEFGLDAGLVLNGGAANSKLVNHGLIGVNGAVLDLATGSGALTYALQGGGGVRLDGGSLFATAPDTSVEQTLDNVDNRISGAGYIGGTASQHNGNEVARLRLINEAKGVIDADIAGRTLVLAASSLYAPAETILNQGVLEADGGVLQVDDAVTGGGVAKVTNGGALLFGAPVANDIQFLGQGRVSLAAPLSYANKISGFDAGDALDLLGISADAATLDGDDRLVLTNGGAVVGRLQLSGDETGLGFVVNAIAGGVRVVAAPTLTVTGAGPQPSINQGGSDRPFAKVVVAERGAATLSVSVKLSDPALGALSHLGAGAYDATAGVYTVSGSAAAVTAALQGLVFTPAFSDDPATTSFTLTVSDGLTTVSDATTTVTAFPPNVSTSATGALILQNGATLALNGVYRNANGLRLDAPDGNGGSRFAVNGALRNTGQLVIGNAGAALSDTVIAQSLVNNGEIDLVGAQSGQQLLSIAGAAGFGTAGVLSGKVSVAGSGAIRFASGQISTVAAGASLSLDGASAFLANAAAPNSNSALTGLASLAGSVSLDHGAAATTARTTVSGALSVGMSGGAGVSRFTSQGALTIAASGDVELGNGVLTAQAIVNTGALGIGGVGGGQSFVDVKGSAGFGAPGMVTGTVELFGDTGSAVLQFASGQITKIAAGATLDLKGPSVIVQTAAAPGSDSALALSQVAGALQVHHGASLTCAAPLTISGFAALDSGGGSGGSRLIANGGLTVTGGGVFDIGSPLPGADLTSDDIVETSALNNYGFIFLHGAAAGGQALLKVNGAAGFGAAGRLTGTVALDGNSAVSFQSGQITTVAANGALSVNGASAFLEDAGALGANSALSLASIAGEVEIRNGASAARASTLVISGYLGVDAYDGDGGSQLTGSGGISIAAGGELDLGNAALSAPDSLSATFLSNGGDVHVAGAGAQFAISSAVANNGRFAVEAGRQEIGGVVSGTGSFSLDDAVLQFDAAVGSGQTVFSQGDDRVALNAAQTFAGALSGFGTGDALDAKNFAAGATAYHFVEDASGAFGVLTLTNGAKIAHITLEGSYTDASFQIAADGGGGTRVKLV